MDFKKYEDLLVLLDDARVPLEVVRSQVIRNMGPKLLEPLMDQSLDPGDIEKISEQIFENLKGSPQYQKYLATRKEHNEKLAQLYKEMEKAGDDDWEALMQAELAATTKNDIIALAKQKNIKINIKL
ncbi:hypothetical protein GF342_03260 [Candidatus Woesearchaeota archaeon]|nr:hypothetical protein [Candidatus Woesearchaeota archaeon]